MSRFIFLDRDDTLVEDRGFTHRVEDYRLLPSVAEGLRCLAAAGYRFAIVTNQSGIGRGYYGEPEFRRFQEHLGADLEARGVSIDASFHCPHRPEEGCGCRKPEPGLLFEARERLGAELDRSWVVGDSERDVGAAQRAGCRGVVLMLTGEGARSDQTVAREVPRALDLVAAAELILEEEQRSDT